ncbi:MAG TPA: TrmH family RNA methyltransferase [Trueperaceae bacterium]|nr:TrmH family RNA methyltransferase [Trueperaceae bacterium]
MRLTSRRSARRTGSRHAAWTSRAPTSSGRPWVARSRYLSAWALRPRWSRGCGPPTYGSWQPHADLTHWQCDLKGGVALVVGREHAGLSDWWLRQADARVAIPMRGSVADSLNVSVAGAVLLYEALRQRFG